MACSQFHPQSPADAAVEAITVSLAVQGRQEGLEPASGRTRAVAVKENTVKHLPKYGFSAEWREEPAGTKLGARLAWAHLGDLPWHPQLMSGAL